MSYPLLLRGDSDPHPAEPEPSASASASDSDLDWAPSPLMPHEGLKPGERWAVLKARRGCSPPPASDDDDLLSGALPPL